MAGGWLIQILNTWIRLNLAFKLFKLTNAHTLLHEKYNKTGCQGVCHAHTSLFSLFFPAFPFKPVRTQRSKVLMRYVEDKLPT